MKINMEDFKKLLKMQTERNERLADISWEFFIRDAFHGRKTPKDYEAILNDNHETDLEMITRAADTFLF